MQPLVVRSNTLPAPASVQPTEARSGVDALRRALPSEYLPSLQVKNTFLELPPQVPQHWEGCCQRRSASAPPATMIEATMIADSTPATTVSVAQAMVATPVTLPNGDKEALGPAPSTVSTCSSARSWAEEGSDESSGHRAAAFSRTTSGDISERASPSLSWVLPGGSSLTPHAPSQSFQRTDVPAPPICAAPELVVLSNSPPPPPTGLPRAVGGEVPRDAKLSKGQARHASALSRRAEQAQQLVETFGLGSPELPTIGSVAHTFGKCKPCAFVYKKGCSNGTGCEFCHLCEPGEKRRRLQELLEKRRRRKEQRSQREQLALERPSVVESMAT